MTTHQNTHPRRRRAIIVGVVLMAAGAGLADLPGATAPGNATDDLKIVPAVPQFRDRNVTITCDNGTTTEITTKF
jgi:hypothetical protein